MYIHVYIYIYIYNLSELQGGPAAAGHAPRGGVRKGETRGHLRVVSNIA